jgi:hypothetical protein
MNSMSADVACVSCGGRCADHGGIDEKLSKRSEPICCDCAATCAGRFSAMARDQEVLADLALWMRRHLKSLHPRSNATGFHGTNKTAGYAVAEIPDWELRQKLEAVEEALKNPAPCARCDERDRAEADDGMQNAAETAGF